MKEQPSRLVNCSCCGQSGERGDFYRDKLNDRYACVDIDACIHRQTLRKAGATDASYVKRLENAFLMVYDLAGMDTHPLPESLPESAYVPGYMSKVRELREVFALVKNHLISDDERQPEDRLMPQER